MQSQLLSVGLISIVLFAGCARTPAPRPHDASVSQHDYLALVHEEAAARYDDRSDEAKEQRRAASDHRAAAQILRDAESRACQGVAEADREIDPFSRREQIVGVKPLVRKVERDEHAMEEVAGAAVILLPAPATTVESFQRVIECHLARNAALGHRVPQMDDCPLVPKGVTARVMPVARYLGVEITSEDAATAEEILRRARLLQSSPDEGPPR